MIVFILFFLFFILLNCLYDDPYSYPSSISLYASKLAELSTNFKLHPPQYVHDVYKNFSESHYSFKYDAHYEEYFGSTLTLSSLEEDNYIWCSLHSVSLGFTTSRFSYAKVKYGTSPSNLDLETPLSSRHHFYHLIHILNLTPSTTYYYRLYAEDEHYGTVVESDIRSFQTLEYDETKYYYLNQSGVPYDLYGISDTHFILLEDIVCINCSRVYYKKAAFVIDGKGVTFDLNGHTIYFGRMEFTDTYAVIVRSRDFEDDDGVNIVANGFIRHIEDHQGVNEFMYKIRETQARYSDKAIDKGSSSMNGGPTIERGKLSFIVQGVYISYWFPEASVMNLFYSRRKYVVRWCNLEDRGTIINNRHQGQHACFTGAGVKDLVYEDHSEFHHNVILRTRHQGAVGFGRVYKNELYSDSFATNAYVVNPADYGSIVADNKFFLAGSHSVGISWSTDDCIVKNNFFHLENFDTGTMRSDEYSGDSVNAIRLTNYGEGGQVRDNLTWVGNHIIGYFNGGGSSIMRGYQIMTDETITNAFVQDTYVRILSRFSHREGTMSKWVLPVATEGVRTEGRLYTNTKPLVYTDSEFVGDTVLVSLGDSYSEGNRHFFYNVKMRKMGNKTNYRTFYFTGKCEDIRFIDCLFLDGADYTDVVNQYTKPEGFYQVIFSLTVMTKKGDKITVKNVVGKVVAKGKADKTGAFQTTLTVFRVDVDDPDRWGLNLANFNPFHIKSEETGKSSTVNITEPTCITYHGDAECKEFDFEDYMDDFYKTDKKKDQDYTVIIISCSIAFAFLLVVGIVVALVFLSKHFVQKKGDQLLKMTSDEEVSSKTPIIQCELEEDVKSKAEE